MLGKIGAELKLVIAGNHDLELDKLFWASQIDYEGNAEDPEDHEEAIKIMRGALAAETGVTFLDEGTHAFILRSGAKFTIYVSPYTPAFGDWAFAYDQREDRFNESHQVAEGVKSIARNPIPSNVDIVMTHGPPRGILDWCPQGNVGCDNVLGAIRRVKPIMHCFGHIHESNGIHIVDWSNPVGNSSPNHYHTSVSHYFDAGHTRNPYPDPITWGTVGGRTLAVNAAIMTDKNKPENAPWLINLDLPHRPYSRGDR